MPTRKGDDNLIGAGRAGQQKLALLQRCELGLMQLCQTAADTAPLSTLNPSLSSFATDVSALCPPLLRSFSSNLATRSDRCWRTLRRRARLRSLLLRLQPKDEPAELVAIGVAHSVVKQRQVVQAGVCDLGQG